MSEDAGMHEAGIREPLDDPLLRRSSAAWGRKELADVVVALSKYDNDADRVIVALASGLRDLLLSVLLNVAGGVALVVAIALGSQGPNSSLSGPSMLLAVVGGLLSISGLFYLLYSVAELRTALAYLKAAAALRAGRARA